MPNWRSSKAKQPTGAGPDPTRPHRFRGWPQKVVQASARGRLIPGSHFRAPTKLLRLTCPRKNEGPVCWQSREIPGNVTTCWGPLVSFQSRNAAGERLAALLQPPALSKATSSWMLGPPATPFCPSGEVFFGFFRKQSGHPSHLGLQLGF